MARTPKFPSDNEVMAIIEKQVLVSSAVTQAPEEYIRKAVMEYIFSYITQYLLLINVNESESNLESGMLSSSIFLFGLEKALLHGLVSSKNGVKIVSGTTDSEETIEKDPKQVAWNKVQEELRSTSLRSIIELTKESLGQKRIRLHTRKTEIHDASGQITGYDKYYVIEVQKPAELDYTKLDLTTFKQDIDLEIFLGNILQYEAGMTDKLLIEASMMPKVSKLIDKIEAWQDSAVESCKTSNHNNISFQVVDDPWKALFGGIF